MQYVLGNMLNGGGGLNADGLSLDLQFATDKTLTARRGPTPTFTRLSGDNGGTTYFGPLVDFDLLGEIPTTGITNGRASWFKSDGENDVTISYTGTRWRTIIVFDGIEEEYLAAPGSEWRPDQADWSGQEFTITTSSTFGIVKAANNEPRFDHDPVTLACRGLLIEEGRTNLVFPSETLTTQTRTVTAVPHTLSFYGTGTVVLSGVAIATVTGTGAYPTRTTLTFTPTAGSLILTVTGSVTQAQLEAGSFATSYIPTTTAPLTRSADVCNIANTSSFWNSDQFTLFGNANFPNPAHDAYAVNFSITSGFFGVRRPNNNTAAAIIRSFGVNADISLGTFVTGTMRMAVAHSSGQQAAAFNGGSATQASSAFSPSLNPALNIGYSGSAGYINGHIASIRYYRKRLPNAKLQALTA